MATPMHPDVADLLDLPDRLDENQSRDDKVRAVLKQYWPKEAAKLKEISPKPGEAPSDDMARHARLMRHQDPEIQAALEVQETMRHVAAADPTENGSYIHWVARLAKEGNIIMPEDVDKVRDTLADFDRIKLRKGFIGQKNISAMKTFADLADVTEANSGLMGRAEQERLAATNGVLSLGKSGAYEAFEVFTEEAAARLFAPPTKWCVKDPSFFSGGNYRGYIYIEKDGKPFALYNEKSQDIKDVRDADLHDYDTDLLKLATKISARFGARIRAMAGHGRLKGDMADVHAEFPHLGRQATSAMKAHARGASSREEIKAALDSASEETIELLVKNKNLKKYPDLMRQVFDLSTAGIDRDMLDSYEELAKTVGIDGTSTRAQLCLAEYSKDAPLLLELIEKGKPSALQLLVGRIGDFPPEVQQALAKPFLGGGPKEILTKLLIDGSGLQSPTTDRLLAWLDYDVEVTDDLACRLSLPSVMKLLAKRPQESTAGFANRPDVTADLLKVIMASQSDDQARLETLLNGVKRGIPKEVIEANADWLKLLGDPSIEGSIEGRYYLGYINWNQLMEALKAVRDPERMYPRVKLDLCRLGELTDEQRDELRKIGFPNTYELNQFIAAGLPVSALEKIISVRTVAKGDADLAVVAAQKALKEKQKLRRGRLNQP